MSQPNEELLEHDRKRQIEIKVTQWAEVVRKAGIKPE